jgi:protease II
MELPETQSETLSDKKAGTKTRVKVNPPTLFEKEHLVFNKWGLEVNDEFWWLNEKAKENIDDPKILKHLEEENAYADSRLVHTTDLQNTLYEEFVKMCFSPERSAETLVS